MSRRVIENVTSAKFCSLFGRESGREYIGLNGVKATLKVNKIAE